MDPERFCLEIAEGGGERLGGFGAFEGGKTRRLKFSHGGFQFSSDFKEQSRPLIIGSPFLEYVGSNGSHLGPARLAHDGSHDIAAEGGSWWAALDLGLLYWAQVRGTAESDQTSDDALVRVHMWLGIAAATEEVGCVEIGAPLRNAVAQSMTPEQIAQAEERSRVWIAEHVEKDVNVVSAKPAC